MPIHRAAVIVTLASLLGAACTPVTPPPTSAAATTTAATSGPPTTGAPPPSTIPPPADRLTIVVDELRASPLAEIGQAYGAATGVSVTVETRSVAESLAGALIAEDAGDLPDVLLVPHDAVGRLADLGHLAELDFETGGLDDRALAGFTVGGRLYGLPYGLEAVALFRNTDLVPTAPATWTELAEQCRSLEPNQCLGVPEDFFHHAGLLFTGGGYLFGDAWDVADLGVEQAVAGARLIRRLVADGVLGRPAGYPELAGEFARSELAFLVAGPWHVAPARDAGPPFAVSALPGEGRDPARPLVGIQGFVTAANGREELSEELLRRLANEPAAMAELALADWRVPALMAARAELPPEVGGFLRSVTDGTIIPNLPAVGELWTPLDEAISDLYRDPARPVEDILAEAAARIRAATDVPGP